MHIKQQEADVHKAAVYIDVLCNGLCSTEASLRALLGAAPAASIDKVIMLDPDPCVPIAFRLRCNI